MAKSMNKEISSVAKEGYGLIFQVYPEAISTLPMAKFWSILFFLMLLTLGLDSAVRNFSFAHSAVLELRKKWTQQWLNWAKMSHLHASKGVPCESDCEQCSPNTESFRIFEMSHPPAMIPWPYRFCWLPSPLEVIGAESFGWFRGKNRETLSPW